MHATTATTAIEQSNSLLMTDTEVSYKLTKLRSTPKELIHLPGQSKAQSFF